MKTLVNKANPQIRITAPEIKVNIDTQTFYIGEEMFDMEDWTLVVKTLVVAKPVDLEKEIEKAQEHYFALKDKGFSLDSMDVSVLARHFYELGLNARKEE